MLLDTPGLDLLDFVHFTNSFEPLCPFQAGALLFRSGCPDLAKVFKPMGDGDGPVVLTNIPDPIRPNRVRQIRPVVIALV